MTTLAQRATRLASSPWAPLVCGAVTALITGWVWGSLDQVAVYHDEAAYILQAKLFASGRWAGLARPLPEFFEQYHVLVTPSLAPKYWPGHALLMVPGIWLGLPGLVPILLSGLTGGLVFALGRRIANQWVGALTWLVWTTAPGSLDYRASYFSEATSGALWLLAWAALLHWHRTGRRGALLAVAACVGWCAVTRPLTAVALALPTAVVVLRRCARERAWRDLGLALALGTALLGVIPLWSARSTGDWRTTPYQLYARTYFPFDRPGNFGRAPAAPLRPLPPDMERFATGNWELVGRPHTVAALPYILAQRLRRIGDDMWHGWRAILIPFAIIALFALPAGAGYAMTTAALLVLVHLVYAHTPSWSVYYVELHPVLGFLTALGVWRAALRLERHSAPLRAAAAAAGVVAGFLACRDVAAVRQAQAQRQAYARGFATLLSRVPDPKTIVFVRYTSDHSVSASLIVNAPDLERARAWIVYDRGADNVRLLRLAPDRVPYLYEEATGTLTRMAASR